MSKGVKVVSINPENLQVTCNVGESTFIAEPFRWGGKMLMKVTTLDDGVTLDRGTRIAIGQKAKGAIKGAGMILPKAELVRPRKPKVQTEVADENLVAVTPVAPAAPRVTIDFNALNVDALRALCKNRGIKGYHKPGVKKIDLIALLNPGDATG